ncbi:MAG: response regulator transcription factor [Acetobacteraceae bacterium]|jgi:two-component system, NarL family, nitrate/nitrite response regulator NarL
MSQGLRILLRADDPVRRQGLAVMLEVAGHRLVPDTPDVILCDLARGTGHPGEAEAPVIVLTDRPLPGEQPAGVLPRAVSAEQLDAALRAAAVGLLVHLPGSIQADGFRPAAEDATPLLTPREAEILTLVGQGMSNKAAARALGISVHTVKFHLEALFAKLDATSRAEAVAKGLRGGVIEL